MFKQKIKIKGNIEIFVIDVKTKNIVKIVKCTNILTNNGIKMHRNWACNVLSGSDPDYNVDTRITHMAVGDDATTPSPSQTALGNELLRKELYPTPDSGCGIDFDGNDTSVFYILIGTSELNGETLREIGLFSETFTDFMISRFLCGNLEKTSSVEFLIKYKFTYSS